MPVLLRNNKRRSLYITHNVKDLTKEALRPRSWYLPGSNEAANPYTSVRKLFYDFNKTAFYGDSNGKDGVNGNPVIANGYSTTTSAKHDSVDGKQGKTDQEVTNNLQNSFQKLELSENRNSMYIPSQDKNNNETVSAVEGEDNAPVSPIPVSPPRVPQPKGPPPKPPSFIQRTVFSSRHSDTASLKEESSSYADFYVPSSNATKQPNFLRRSHKRRSFDPTNTKFKALDYMHHVTNDDDLASLSSMGRYSVRSQPPLSAPSPLSPENRIEEKVDPKPMLERYLRDAEQDICSGMFVFMNFLFLLSLLSTQDC